MRRLKPPHSLLERTRTTRVVLATTHRDHDPTNNDASNLAALCQRCHILHDKPECPAAINQGETRIASFGNVPEPMIVVAASECVQTGPEGT